MSTAKSGKPVKGAIDPGFAAVVTMIRDAREQALQAVNTGLIDLYWRIGQHISRKIAAAEWGDGVVDQLAAHIAREQPGLRGFTRPNLFRMRQFYEAYADDNIVSALPRQLPWTHNLIILSQSKRAEEREFYLRMAVQEKWSSRELERQFKGALFERTALAPPQVSPTLMKSQRWRTPKSNTRRRLRVEKPWMHGGQRVAFRRFPVRGRHAVDVHSPGPRRALHALNL